MLSFSVSVAARLSMPPPPLPVVGTVFELTSLLFSVVVPPTAGLFAVVSEYVQSEARLTDPPPAALTLFTAATSPAPPAEHGTFTEAAAPAAVEATRAAAAVETTRAPRRPAWLRKR